MARTVPVYFGNRDYFKFLNPKRAVFCEISDATINTLRKFKTSNKFNIPNVNFEDVGMPFLYYNKSESPRISDAYNHVRWGVKMLQDELKPCVEEVKFLDKNMEAYVDKLSQPFFLGDRLEDSAFDGTYTARAFVDILKMLKSPLLDAVEYRFGQDTKTRTYRYHFEDNIIDEAVHAISKS